MKIIINFIFFIFTCITVNSQWVKLNTGVNYRFTKAFFVNEDMGFVSYLKYDTTFLFKTTDGGSNWQSILTNNYKINTVTFLNENTGYGIGQHIYKTTDGGLNWTLIYNVGFKTTTDIQFLDTNNGYVTYTSNEQYSGIYRTTNAGINWIETHGIGTAGIIDCVNFLDINNGYVGGWEPVHGPGTIYFTTNAGVNWYHSVSLVGPPVIRISFLNYDTGFCVQTQSSIFRTTNNGINWHSISSFCVDFKAFSVDTIYYIQNNYDSSFIMRTTDGGNTWVEQYRIQLIIPFIRIYFLNRNVGYVIGGNGYILKTTNGGDPIGIRKASDEVPVRFSIFQNYPNPFNPSTSIDYEIPKAGYVKIIVYDLLGNEVTSLVNEHQQPGKYQVTWDASNFASGVYFYKLVVSGAEPQLQSYMQVRKMVVIK